MLLNTTTIISGGSKGEKSGTESHVILLWLGEGGLKVLGKFDNRNNTWIGMKNIPGELSVAYHGFCYNSNNPFPLVENIMNQGFIAGRRQTYANSPDIRHPGRNCGFWAYFTPNIT